MTYYLTVQSMRERIGYFILGIIFLCMAYVGWKEFLPILNSGSQDFVYGIGSACIFFVLVFFSILAIGVLGYPLTEEFDDKEKARKRKR